jgi:arylsulfatase A-like enzyme
LEETLRQFSHIQNEQRRKYAAQISLMDGAIGEVLTALDETQQRERTLIFFFSDNGGQTAASSDNGVLRERKGTLYEGGVRVPFLVSWPGTIPAGTEFLQPVSTLDIFATSVSVAGITSPAPKPLDGVNLLPHLTGADSEAPHKQLFWRMSGRRSFAVREGNWKLLRIGDAPAELYDLATDVSEKNNVAAAHADVTARLTADLEAWNKQLVDPGFPGSSVKSEDWGPGGANQKNVQKKKKAGK